MATKPRTNEGIREALAEVPVGASFFIENARNSEVQRIRNVAHSMGIKLTTRRTPLDEVHFKPGVRIWVKEKTMEKKEV